MSKAPLTLSERARRLAEAQRLRYDPARELFEELNEIRDFCEEYVARDASESLEALTEAVEALANLASHDVGLNSGVTDDLAASIVELEQTLPEAESLQGLIDAYDQLEEALDRVQEHRDDPSSGDQDEKAEARDEVRNALEALADALDQLDPPAPVAPPVAPPSGLDLQRLRDSAESVAQRPGRGASSRAVFCFAVVALLDYQMTGRAEEGLMAQIVQEYQERG